MDAYNDRVEREEYLSKISNVLQGDCYEDCREIFLSVVGKYYSIPPGSNSLEGLDALAVVLCLW